jgi:ubiquitin C-terminal hydrolase
MNETIIKYNGLSNPGCLCYINSIIQQLFMMPLFNNNITSINIIENNDINDKDIIDNISLYPIISSLQKLFIEMNSKQYIHTLDEEYDICVISFAQTLHTARLNRIDNDLRYKYDENININKPRDTITFLTELLEEIDNEIIAINNNNINNNNINNNYSLISDIFNGNIKHNFIAIDDGEKYITSTTEKFNFLSLSINCNNNNNNDNNNIDNEDSDSDSSTLELSMTYALSEYFSDKTISYIWNKKQFNNNNDNNDNNNNNNNYNNNDNNNNNNNDGIPNSNSSIFPFTINNSIKQQKLTTITLSTTMTTTISKLPFHLLIHLKRFKYDFEIKDKIKLNNYFNFPMEINLNDYISNNIDLGDNNSSKYKLCGIVLHQGDIYKGHYLSLVKERNDINKNDKDNSSIDKDESDRKDKSKQCGVIDIDKNTDEDIDKDRNSNNWFEFDDEWTGQFDLLNLSDVAYGSNYNDTNDSSDNDEDNSNAYILIYDKII